MTGTKHYATVGDLAQSAGLGDAANTSGAFVHEIITPMQKLGANAKYVGEATSFEQIKNLTNVNPNAVVSFSVKWSMSGSEVGHTLLARRGMFGITYIIDRSGKIVTDIAELKSSYSGIDSAVPYGSIGVIQNARTVTLLDNVPSLLNILAVEVRSIPTAVIVPGDPSPLSIFPMNPYKAPIKNRKYQVVSGDFLSKIAGKVYSDTNLWPAIYQANRALIGPSPHNPYGLKVGQELIIP